MIDLWDVILILVAIAVSICQIILFFKIWGMCNNVARLTRKLTLENKEEITEITDKEGIKPKENKKGDTLMNVALGIIIVALIALMIWGNW